MEQLKKVNMMQIYQMWKNLTIGILVMIGVIVFTRLLPFYFAPAVALIGAAVLYTIIYYNGINRSPSCILTIYCFFYCLIGYSFVSIVLNVLFAWGIIRLPDEIIFFNRPYIPSLLLAPVSAVILFFLYFRRNNLQVCVECRLHNGDHYDRGQLGRILQHETSFQLRNLIYIFAILSIIVWTYYLKFYIKVNLNARDWYIFAWIFVIVMLLDELYFVFRYYNLYLDLKESDELISPETEEDFRTVTYLRFYVICGNHIFVDTKAIDPSTPYREVVDTPFIKRRNANGVRIDEVKNEIAEMTGVKGGELRFFFGRQSPDMANARLLRYFYFLDGDISDYPELKAKGEWMDFNKFKKIYVTSPGNMSSRALSDLTRLATIIQTEKIFDERGYRKNKIKSYQPGFSLKDVRQSTLDFQDDKWIRISMFNSDTPFYSLKRWWRHIKGKGNVSKSVPERHID